MLPRLAAVVVSAALVAASATCCTSRPTQRIAATPRDGWVRLGPNVRLRDDTPPLETVRPPAEPVRTWGAAGPSTDAGTNGDYGPSGSAGPASVPGYDGSFGYGYTPFLAPGGAVPPGLRLPSDERATSPFAEPFKASFPGGDVTAHRPGLSTGSGVYGRQDDEPKPAPAPRR
ncbi:MAG: hypothetical protein U1E39_07735 [Planctomycetota bacterium]